MNVKRAVIAAATGLLMTGMVAAQPYGGMGPGMMGGYGGGYGYGPGMMGGYGPGGYGMGPGMMWGYGANAYADLNLSAEQRKKIDEIQEQAANTMWQLMGTMHQQGYHMHGALGPEPLDEQAARKAYESMAATQKAMFEAQLDARKKVDGVLTAEQREQLRRSWGGR
jgi:Spy/CpxP family protein refolding chaperone